MFNSIQRLQEESTTGTKEESSIDEQESPANLLPLCSKSSRTIPTDASTEVLKAHQSQHICCHTRPLKHKRRHAMHQEEVVVLRTFQSAPNIELPRPSTVEQLTIP